MPPDDVRFMVLPTQTGLFEPIVGVGKALITIEVVAVAVQPLALVTVTV